MIVISACLVGQRCRYDGGGYDQYPALRQRVLEGRAIAICPEVLGGLSVPRPAAEIQGGDGRAVLAGCARVVCRDGSDVTEAFRTGAQEACRLAESCGASAAILKARSPSCGVDAIRDGTFTGGLAAGPGVTACRLASLGIPLFDEQTWEDRAAAAIL